MEYRFRGYDAVGDKGWVYGDLVHNKKVSETGLESRVMVGGYEVVPESVGLYTGLCDCEGKEIYEGDAIRHSSGWGGIVTWHEDGYFFINESNGSYSSDSYTPLGEMLRKYELVVFDNSRLIKKQKK